MNTINDMKTSISIEKGKKKNMDLLYLYFIDKYKSIENILGSYDIIFRDIENYLFSIRDSNCVTDINTYENLGSMDDYHYTMNIHPFFPLFHISFLYFIHPKENIDISIVKQIITLILSYYDLQGIKKEKENKTYISDCFLRIITDNEGFFATLLKYRRIFFEVFEYSKTQIQAFTQIYSHQEHTKVFLKNFIHYIIDEIYDTDILMIILGNPQNNIDFIQLRNKTEEFITIIDRIIDFYRSNKIKSRIDDYTNKMTSMKNKRNDIIDANMNINKRRHSISMASLYDIKNEYDYTDTETKIFSSRNEHSQRRNSVMIRRKSIDDNVGSILQIGFELLLKNIDEIRFHKLCDFLKERGDDILKSPDNIIKLRSLIENNEGFSKILFEKNKELFNIIGLDE